ncbi:MAG: hypothetical protein AB8B96_16335 [Lysobacterales bacterium]
MFNFTYDASVFMVVFFLLVPVTLAWLCRRVGGWRKFLWLLLTVVFSWGALIALLVLVPRKLASAEERTPWQQRVWVIGALVLVTIVSPALGLLSDEFLDAPMIQSSVLPIETAYQAIGRRSYHREVLKKIQAKHQWRYLWHVVFTNVALLQDEPFGLNPVVRMKFGDGSILQYHVRKIGLDEIRLEVQKGRDADNNAIVPPAQAHKYRGTRGELGSAENIAAFTAYLQRIGVEVVDEVPGAAAARWHCPGPDFRCRVFAQDQ